MSRRNHIRMHRVVRILLLVGWANVTLAFFPPIEPPAPPPKPGDKTKGEVSSKKPGNTRDNNPGETHAQNSPPFFCQCSRQPKGYQCDQIIGFKDYEWTHERSAQFAFVIADLAEKLPEGRFAMAIQGVADSKEISDFKYWRQVDPRQVTTECQRQEGKITNEDLALLRSCTIAKAIERYRPIHIKVMDPKAYRPEDKKVGDAYKAAVVYLLGDNGGCK